MSQQQHNSAADFTRLQHALAAASIATVTATGGCGSSTSASTASAASPSTPAHAASSAASPNKHPASDKQPAPQAQAASPPTTAASLSAQQNDDEAMHRRMSQRFPMRILTINAGSSSLKLSVYEQKEPGASPRCVDNKTVSNKEEPVELLSKYVAQHGGAVGHSDSGKGGSKDSSSSGSSGSSDSGQVPPIRLVVHRIVHGGNVFARPTLLHENTVEKLEKLNKLAPLHNPPAIRLIRASLRAFPPSSDGDESDPRHVQHVGVFDTSFFHDLPTVARTYALPSDLAERHGIRRFGFHGIAHEAMLREMSHRVKGKEKGGRLITLQLGSGCSAAAILKGQPIDTSMGMTPLEGLVMATRGGDIDPGLLTFLQRHEPSLATPDALDDLLNHKSGFLGVSGGLSNNMKTLSESDAPQAKLAIDLFCYRLIQYIGAYAAVLGGVDTIAFGGGIGEHGADVRLKVLSQLSGFLQLRVDERANAAAKGVTARISTSDSQVEVWVVEVREDEIMVREAVHATQAPSKSQL